MPKIRRVVMDASLQAAGSYVATAAILVRGAVLARLLGPAGIGTIATVGLVITYAQYSDLGIVNALTRMIPLSLGEGKEEDADRWALYGLVAKVAGGLAVGAAVVGYVALRWDVLPEALRFGLLTASAVLTLQGVTTAQQIVLRGRQRFGRASTLVAAIALLNLVAGIAGAVVAGVTGVFVGQLAAFVVATAIGFALTGKPGRHRLAWGETKTLAGIGFPVTVLAFVNYNLIYLDQVVILSFLDRVALGVYTIVLYAGAALFLLPTVVATTVSPRLLRRYGETKELQSISEMTWQPVRFLSLVLPLAVLGAAVVVPAAIELLLPEYVGAIQPLRIYLVGMFFLSLNLGVSDTLLALNKHRRNIPILAGAVALNVGADVVLVGVADLGLTGVALGSAITYAAYWLASSTLVRWMYDPRVGAAIAYNLRRGVPGFVLAGVALLAWATGTIDSSHPVPELGLIAAAAAVTFVRWRAGALVEGEVSA